MAALLEPGTSSEAQTEPLASEPRVLCCRWDRSYYSKRVEEEQFQASRARGAASKAAYDEWAEQLKAKAAHAASAAAASRTASAF